MPSPNLAITHVTKAQNDKVTTINTKDDNLELALTDAIDIDNDTATVTLTTTEAGEALGNLFYRFIGTPGATQTCNVPANTKMYAIENALTDDNDLIVQVTGGGGVSVTVQVGFRALLYVDASGDVISLGSETLAGGAGTFVLCVPFGSSATTAHGALPLFLDVTNGVTSAVSPDIGYPVNRVGSIIGGAMMLECSVNSVGGDLEFNIYVNGSIVFTGTVTVGATGSFTITATQGAGIDTVAVGDIIGFDVDLAPASTFQGSIRNLVGYMEVAQEL